MNSCVNRLPRVAAWTLQRSSRLTRCFAPASPKGDYEKAVDTIKDYILAGDCMQVVPSQRMSIDFKAAPIDLYRALRCFNPTPYMYFFNFGDFHVVGSSPEVLVRVEDNLITVRPIAGTRPRGATEEADLALEEDLLSDDKEIAEHLMLIDLGRNDTGRVSEVGSVKLTEKMVIERYSNVMHIVSNVTGQLKSGLTAMDALRAILPAILVVWLARKFVRWKSSTNWSRSSAVCMAGLWVTSPGTAIWIQRLRSVLQ